MSSKAKAKAKAKSKSKALIRFSLALLLVLGSWGTPLNPLTPKNPDGALSLIAHAYAEPESRPDDQVGGVPLSERPVEDSPRIEAVSALVATSDGHVLWMRNGRLPVPMASTTKIMTAVLAIEAGNLERECYVTQGAASTDGSSAWLRSGDVLTMYQLLICLMLPSGNDAAMAIAENLAPNSFDFVDMMNAKAASLGMKNTHYVDPHGLNEENLYSTVEDYLILTRYAMRFPVFREIVLMRDATVQIMDRPTYYVNTNKLFGMMDGVIGIKTGTNVYANACLVSAVRRDGIVFYAIVFGSPTDSSRYNDTIALYEWAFAHYRTVELINASVKVGDMALTDWIDKSVPVHAPRPIALEVFDIAGPITQEVDLDNWVGPVIKGQRVGRVIWMQGGEVIATSELVAGETVEEPAFWERFSIGWDRFWGGFSDKPRHRETDIYLPPVFELPDGI